MKMNPIKPNEICEQMETIFPEYVIEAINNCLKKKYRGEKSVSIKMKFIIEEILKLAPEGTTSGFLFDNKYLDFESLYEKFGWKVSYDKPGWDETYDSFYLFEAKPYIFNENRIVNE